MTLAVVKIKTKYDYEIRICFISFEIHVAVFCACILKMFGNVYEYD